MTKHQNDMHTDITTLCYIIKISLLYILQAGIEEDQLTIVFEEEAISSFCQHMHFDHPSYTHTQDDTFKNDLENVKKYIVVNLGGKCRYIISCVLNFAHLN